MGFFNSLKKSSQNITGNNKGGNTSNLITTGKNKDDGGHDHRTNTGKNRTPSQKEGDRKRKKSDGDS